MAWGGALGAAAARRGALTVGIARAERRPAGLVRIGRSGVWAPGHDGAGGGRAVLRRLDERAACATLAWSSPDSVGPGPVLCLFRQQPGKHDCAPGISVPTRALHWCPQSDGPVDDRLCDFRHHDWRM